MMNNESILIDCSNITKFIHQLKELLKYDFKVYVKVENLNLRIFGNNESLTECRKATDYFNKADSQYLLAINAYTKEALQINDLILLFESRCKVLILLEDTTLFLFGESTNVKLLYNFFLKYDRKGALQNLTFEFGEEEMTRLEVLCSLCDIKLPPSLELKINVFIYNILVYRENLFNQISLDSLCDELVTINNHSTKEDNSQSVDSGKSSFVISADKSQLTNQQYNVDNISIPQDNDSKFRTIIIDGNDLAFGHGGGKVFSYMGVKIAIDYFVSRGYTKIYAMLPRHRQPMGGIIFEQLEHEDRLKYTPSRIVNHVRETPYDDRSILDAAVATDGVVLSNHQYRDLISVRKYKEIISDRLIPYTFIEDHLIVPNDPRGLHGPSLIDILSNTPKVVQKSPVKPTKQKKVKAGPQAKTVSGTNPRGQCQPALSSRQIDLYNLVTDIIPMQSELIRQVIIGNPEVKDANVIVNYVLMADPGPL